MAPPSISQLVGIDPLALRIARLRALRGPNVWRLAPVIACDVAPGTLESLTTADVPGFADRLVAALPSLQEHPCSRGAPGGFVERLREGTGWPHVLEHVAIELQNLGGSDVSFGRVVESGDAGVWRVIVEYDEEVVGLASMREAHGLVQRCLAGEQPDCGDLIERLRALARSARLGPSTGALVEEARRRGIPVRRLNDRSLIQLGLGRHLRRLEATMSDRTSIIAVEMAQDKDLTRRVLRNIGLSVPAGSAVRSVDEAVATACEIGFPVILKPLSANQGRGISPALYGEDDVRWAWDAAREFHPRLVVERYVEGRDHRVIVVNGTVAAVAERIAAHVIGDGTLSVRELIVEANRDPRRGPDHSQVLSYIPMDAATEEFLSRSGRTLDTVPAPGEQITLRATANLSTGGTSIDRTDEIHPDNVTMCEMAAGIIGLDIAGLDVITPDIGVPFHENGAVIIEVNAAPGIRMHTDPAAGVPRNVAAPILDMLYPPGSRATIPVIAVTGTNGKTTTTRLIAHLFRHAGRVVGFTTTDGVYLHTRLVVAGDMTGPFGANVILTNPTVEVAVLETARGGILRAGLGFDECDVGIVLNVSGDHLGLDGIQSLEQLAEVKGVIPSVVKRRGYAVLNVDDPHVVAMRDLTRGDVVLFSARTEGPPNPALAEHLEDGGTAVLIEDDAFVVRRGRLTIPIARVRDVPLTIGGAAGFQRENIAAAIAAAFVHGMRYEEIRAGLMTFFPSAELTPGRLNLLRVPEGRVLVDYAHNPAAVEAIVELVMHMDACRRLGVITAPGDRRDDDIRAVGRLCARLDRVVLKEDADLRGRAPGEIARLLTEGLVSAGMDPTMIRVASDEPAAVDIAIDAMSEGDLVVVLAVDVAAVLAQLAPLSPGS